MKKRTKGITISYLYFILNTILSVVLSSFVVRTVGKTDYGVYQTMSAFVSYLVLLEFGTGTLMTRNLSVLKKDGSDFDSVNKNISTIWTISSFLSVLIVCVSAVFYFCIPLIYSYSLNVNQIVFGKKIFIYTALNLLFNFLTQTLNGLILAYEYYIFEKTTAIIKLFCRLILVFLLLNFDKNIIWVPMIDLFLTLICFIVTLLFVVAKIKVKLTYKCFDRDVFVACLPLALAMLLQTFVNTANNNVDKFLISIMMRPEDVSIYAISMTIFSMFSSVASLPVAMYMPKIAREISNNISNDELNNSLVEPCRFNVIVTGLICFGLVVVGRQFIVLVYGIDYLESWIYAIIVIIPNFFVMANSIVINIVDVFNKRHIRSLILASSTIVNLVLTILGIGLFGMLGAAIATCISFILQFFLLNYFYIRSLKLDIVKLLKNTFKGILPCLLISTILCFFIGYFITNILLSFFIAGFSFVLLFSILFMLFGASADERELVTKFVGKIKIFK